MSVETMKAAALECLMSGPWVPSRTDPAAPAIHLLKADGLPIVSREVQVEGFFLTEHRLIDSDLSPDQIKAQRRAGLAFALRWHRSEPADHWPELVRTIPDQFARDEAKQYLASITIRGRVAGAH